MDSLSLEAAAEFAATLETKLAQALGSLPADTPSLASAQQLHATLHCAIDNLGLLLSGLNLLAHRADRIADETEFGFLVQPDRQMLSVAFDADANKLLDACYDMLASEARIATFIAVARGDLQQESWFKLGREHTEAFGCMILLSWTGTMFEYLMPAIWMRSYPDTLIARTLEACCSVQRSFARAHNIPWGISESGYARKDDAGHYHYQAFGVPAIALKFDATAGPVISPYSTFLALQVNSLAALKNLRHMASAEWVGPYGFYESGDYALSPGIAVLTREWMAHHQGMSLLAILNLLHANIVQQWFHTSPLLQSAEPLLHEMPASKAVLRAEMKEFAGVRNVPAHAA